MRRLFSPRSTFTMTFQQKTILWRPVIAVAIVQGSIALMWVVYNLYLPKFLKDLGYASSLGLVLLGIEAIVGAVMEPVAGTVNDRTLRGFGVQFPLVLGGALVSAAMFVLIPWVALWGLSAATMKFFFVMFVILWASAMATFRAPVLSLLGRYSNQTQLPQASSALMMSGALVQIFSVPSQKGILEWVRPFWTFGISGLVLVAAIAGLYAAGPMQSLTKVPPGRPSQGMDLGRVGVLVFLGGAIALGLMMVRKVLLPQPTMELGLSVFMAGNLLALLPAGWVAVRVGNVRCLFWSLVSAIGWVLMLTLPALWPMAWFGLGITIAFVMNAALPIAIAQSTANQTGVAVGAYFGGVSIAGVVIHFLTLAIGPLSPEVASRLAVVAFAGAIGGVWRLYPKPWATQTKYRPKI